jgi:hypothetical protein
VLDTLYSAIYSELVHGKSTRLGERDYTSSETRQLALELPKLEHGKSTILVGKLGY